MLQFCEGEGHGQTCERVRELGVGARSVGASTDGGATAPGPGGGAAAGLRIESGANGAGDWPLGAVDLSAAQPLPGWGDRRGRSARVARWAATPEHDGRAGRPSAGAVPGSRPERRHPGGRPGQGRVGSATGAAMALSSVYNLLHRHGWRKLAPDRRHPHSDPEAQQAWKKNSPAGSPNSVRSGPGKARSS